VDTHADVTGADPADDSVTVAHAEPTRPGEFGLEPSPSKKVKGSSVTGRRALLVAGAAAAVVAIVMLRSSSNVAQTEGPDAAIDAPIPEATRSPVAAEPTDVSTPDPTPVDAAWDYSLAIGSVRDLEDASTYQRRLGAEAASTWFGLAPLVVNGTVFNRILAGLASDSLGAEGMKAQIGSAVDEDAAPWYARPAGLAFLLGEFTALTEARDRARAVTDDGVPSYVLAVEYSDGSERYRVYAGAYGTEEEAAHLRTELQSRLLPTSLVERIGKLPR
jgi:hypothetical protein